MKVFLLNLSLCVAFTAAQYSDFEGRYFTFPLSAAAYSNNPKTCLQNMQGDYNITFYNQYTPKCDLKNDSCSGFTAVAHDDELIIVSFRGTNNKEQLFTEGLAYSNLTAFGGGRVATYFYIAFSSVWNSGMKNDVNTLKNKYPKYSIFFVGHSLGGAMAALAAATVVSTGIKSADYVILETMGQPRTGNIAFAAAFDALGIEAYRITHGRDIVPHLPYENDDGYHHHLAEVWYDNDMTVGQTFVECDFIEEDSDCSDSDSVFDISLYTHTHYFDLDVSIFGIGGCVGNPKMLHPKALAKINGKQRKRFRKMKTRTHAITG